MLDEIRRLERASRGLELGTEDRERSRDKVIRYTETFLDELPDLPAFSVTEDGGASIYQTKIGEEPKDLDHLLTVLDRYVNRPGVNGASGGHRYIPISSLYHGALGDFLAAVHNKYAGVFYPAPGAVRMEHQLLRWMADLTGLPETAGGNLTSSGSLAHLIGVVTAREAYGLKAKDFHRTVVYLSGQTHHCVEKALRVAGLGETVKRYLPLDEGYRIRSEYLIRMVEEDRANGLIPWMLVANAGAINTGAVDPLDRLGEIANGMKLWFQVDAAYGGFFMLCERQRAILKGIERADALVLDPHKGLFIPAGLGAVLIRDKMLCLKAHSFQAAYLQDAQAAEEELSPAQLSPELTKHFRALRLWLPLQFHGLAPFRAALQEKILLARYFYQKLAKIKGFEPGPFPDLTVVVFRYLPEKGDPDEFNKKLHAAMIEDGRIFISITILDGRFMLRLAPLSFRTHLDHIDLALSLLSEKAFGLSQNA